MAKKAVHKSSNSWPLGQRPGFLIRRLHQIHVALFQKKCAAFDVTPLQYSLLSALARRGTADQTTLAADVALDRTTTTGALKRLQSRKFIERAVDQPGSPGADVPADKGRRKPAAPDGSVGARRPPRDRGGFEQGRAKAVHRDDAAHRGCEFQRRQGDDGRRLKRLIAGHWAGAYNLCTVPQKQQRRKN